MIINNDFLSAMERSIKGLGYNEEDGPIVEMWWGIGSIVTHVYVLYKVTQKKEWTKEEFFEGST